MSNPSSKLFISSTQASSDPATGKNGGGAEASVANLQIFIDKFVCKANSAGLGYFFFEVGFLLKITFLLSPDPSRLQFIDEQWKVRGCALNVDGLFIFIFLSTGVQIWRR